MALAAQRGQYPRTGSPGRPSLPHTEDDLRYARRRYLTDDACRQCARIIASATFASRQVALWGDGMTAVASDSTHFSAFDQNIFTEWHSRCRRATTVAAQRGPPQTSPLFEEAALSAANDG